MRDEYEEGYLDGVNDFQPQNIHNPEYLEGYHAGHISYFMTHGPHLCKRCPIEGYSPEEIAQYAGNIPNKPQRGNPSCHN